MDNEAVVSPLTGLPNVSLIRHYSTRQLVGSWQKAYGIDIREEFDGVSAVSEFRCNETGLVFFTPPEAAGSRHLYQSLQKFDWYYLDDKWEYKQALKDLKSCRRILEVGCGRGAFLGHARKAGLEARGIELSPSAVEEALAQGLAVEALPLESAAEKYEGQLDAVCSFQVLEHVADPRGFVSSCVRALMPGGMLLIAVPDCGGYVRLEESLLNLPPHHMLHWDLQSLKALEELFPLRLERVRREPLARVHVEAFVAAHASQWSERSIARHTICHWRVLNLWKLLLKAGLRRLFNGHSLYVLLRKQ